MRELRRNRRRGSDAREARGSKLKAGVDIPTPEEIRRLTQTLIGRYRPLLLTAVFTGLRASELRGLRWTDIDFKAAELHVRQRADRHCRIGKPKTAAAERTVPLPPMLVKELREWKLQCPNGTLGLVFPNGAGNVEQHVNKISPACTRYEFLRLMVHQSEGGRRPGASAQGHTAPHGPFLDYGHA